MLLAEICDSFLRHDDFLSQRIDTFDAPTFLSHEGWMASGAPPPRIPPVEDRCFSLTMLHRLGPMMPSSSRSGSGYRLLAVLLSQTDRVADLSS